MTPGQIASYKAACAELDSPAPAAAGDDPAVAEAIDRITNAVNGLSNLAELVRARPEMASRISLKVWDINVAVGYPNDGEAADRIASLAEAAKPYADTVEIWHNNDYGGVEAMFGPIPLHIYAPLDHVGGVVKRKAVDWRPDARLAGYAPAKTS